MLKATVKYSVVLLAAACSQALWAEHVDGPDIDVEIKKLGAAYALLVSFAAQPEVSAASYSIEGEQPGQEDTTLQTAKLSLYREFQSEQHDWSWYLQGAAHYSSLKQKNDFMLGAPFDGTTKFEWTGYGALLEAGFIVPMSQRFSWTAWFITGTPRPVYFVETLGFCTSTSTIRFRSTPAHTYSTATLRASTNPANLAVLTMVRPRQHQLCRRQC